MIDVTATTLRKDFSRLLDRAARGDETTIIRRGRPVARLVPIEPALEIDRSRAPKKSIRKRIK